MASKLHTRSADLTRAADPNNPEPGASSNGVIAVASNAPAGGAASPPANDNRAGVNAEIRSLARDTQLGDDFANGLIDRSASIDQARAAALDALRTRSNMPIQTQRIQVGFSHDDPQLHCRHMGEALYARMVPAHQLSEPARAYAFMPMFDIGRECLRLRGVPVIGQSRAELLTRMLTTSDFPIVLGDAVGRSLRRAYMASPPAIKRVARQTTAPDFRARHRIMLGEAPSLRQTNEAGEFKYGAMAEAKETYRLKTFGRIISISRPAIINDDLGAFADLAMKFGAAAASMEASQLVELLVSNAGLGPTMDDATVLFHTNHGNVSGTGAAIAESTLTAARLAMRRQTGLQTEIGDDEAEPIEVTPKFLLVPPDLETKAEKELSAIYAAQTANVNPFVNKLEIVVENRLTDAFRWYLVADQALVDGLEYAYLEGQPGPQIETKSGFEVDGVQLKVREDFGCGFVETRSWYTNAGH